MARRELECRNLYSLKNASYHSLMSSQRRQILFIEQEIPHYRAPVLTAIASAIDADFRFFHGATTASQAFQEASAGDLPPSTTHIFVRWCLHDRIVLHNYWSALRNKTRGRDLVIVRHNPRSLFLLPFMLWCRLLRIPVVVWGQGYSRNRPFRPYAHPLDMLNLAIVRSARAYVAYTDEIHCGYGVELLSVEAAKIAGSYDRDSKLSHARAIPLSDELMNSTRCSIHALV